MASRVRLLLLSNSGRPFLAHCRDAIVAFLGERKRVAFVTAATMWDETEYHARCREALAPVGLEVLHLRWNADPLDTLAKAEGVFVGGGNTYALLQRLRDARLLAPLRERVLAGVPYLGASAGSNVAAPRILTTNDWNVVGLDAFDALDLVPFNINPHYLETDPAMAPGSETRDERIAQYHVVWSNPVAGLEEQSAVRVEDGVATVLGRARVKWFERGRDPRWFAAGERLPV